MKYILMMITFGTLFMCGCATQNVQYVQVNSRDAVLRYLQPTTRDEQIFYLAEVKRKAAIFCGSEYRLVNQVRSLGNSGLNKSEGKAVKYDYVEFVCEESISDRDLPVPAQSSAY